ncbi:hypothetical protein GCM10020219_059510 [Nonomuraea dietziae]
MRGAVGVPAVAARDVVEDRAELVAAHRRDRGVAREQAAPYSDRDLVGEVAADLGHARNLAPGGVGDEVTDRVQQARAQLGGHGLAEQHQVVCSR